MCVTELSKINLVLSCLVLSYFPQEPVELMAMYGNSSGTSEIEAKSDHTKVSSKKYSGKKAWEVNGYCKLLCCI